MKYLFKIILLISVIFIFCNQKVFSIDWEVVCPNDYDSYIWEDKILASIGEDYMNLIDGRLYNYGQVLGLKKTIINGKETFIFNKNQFSFNGNINDKSAYGVLISSIIKQHSNGATNESCPFTNPDYREASFILENECKVEKSCYLKLNQSSNIICADQGWSQSEIDANITTYNGIKYVKVSNTTEVCGISCCEWVVRYNCIDNYPTGMGSNNIAIIGINKNILSNSLCLSNSYDDCLTGQLVICGGYCD